MGSKFFSRFVIGAFILGVVPVVKLNAQCQGFTVDITSSPPPPFNLCPGETITLISNVTGGTPPYTYLWSNGETTPNIIITPPANGSEMLAVTDDNGCLAENSFHVKASVWTVDFLFNGWTYCMGDSMELFAYPDFPAGTTFLWSTGATTTSIFITNSGTYSLTATSPTGQCSATNTEFVQMSFFPSPNPNITGTIVLCPGQNGTLTASGDPGDTFAWSTGEGTQSITISAPGTYSVTATNDSGCTGTDTVEVTTGGVPPILNNPAPICPGQSTIVEVTNATEFTDFLWSNNGTGSSITVTSPGTYTVTVTVAGGCTATGSASVVSGNPNINITGTMTPVTSCSSPNGAVDLSVSPAGTYTFNWSNGATTEDLANVGAGSYTVTVTENGGCTSSSSFTVANNTTPPVPTATPTPSSCSQNNGAVDLSVTPAGSYTFSWSNGATTEDLVNIAAGSYTVTVTSTGSGCTATASATVQNNNPPITITGNSTPLTSCNSPNGAVDITPSPAGTYTFTWSNGATTEDLQNVGAGSYAVTVSAGGSCTGTASFTVANNTTPPVPIAIPTPASCGQNNGAIDLNVTPAGSYTFSWSNGATTEDLVNIAAGSYTVTVTSTTSGCFANASTTVQDNSFIPNITGATIPVTSCLVPNGSISTTITPVANYSFIWSNGETTQDLSGLTAGTYSVTASAGGSCTGSASFTVTNATAPPSLSAIITPAVCGSADGAIDLTVAPAGSYVFSWSNGASTEDLADLLPGNYTVIATVTVTGCTATATYNVTNNSSNFTLTGSSTPVTNCGTPNGQINLSVSPTGVYDFLWSNGDTTEDLQNIAAGSYTVTVTQAGACTGEASFQVTAQVVLPLLSQTTTPATCGQPNGAVDLSVAPAGTYVFLWSNGATSEDLQNIAAGSYQVTVTGSNGCTSTTSATVPNNSTTINLTGTTTANTSCTSSNGAVDLNASPAGNYGFIWSNGATTEDLQNVAAGSYTVTVSAGGNCTSTAIFTVINNSGAPNLVLAANPAFCGQNDGSVDLTVSPSGAYVFVWSNGATGEDLQNLAAGNYIVTVTGTNGCSSTAQATVANTVTNFSAIGTVTPNSSCVSPNGNIDLSISPPGSYIFLWSNGATTEDLQNLAPGTYAVTATQGLTCTNTASFTVLDNSSAPVLSQITNPANCGQSDGAIDLTVAPFSGNTFLWSNGAMTEDLQNLAPGTYTVTCTGANGCTASLPIDVPSENATMTLSTLPTANLSCSSPSGAVDLTVSTPSTFTCLWSSGATTEDLQNLVSGTYFVTVTDANGCTETASATVGGPAQPLITVAGPASACQGQTATLTAGLGFSTYLWSNGATANSITVSQTGTYSVTATDANGCTATDGQPFQSFPLPLPVINGPAAICGGDTVFSVSGGIFTQTNWSTGEMTPNITVSQSGIYAVTVTNADGCTATDSHALTVGGGLSPDIMATLTDCNGSTTLDAGIGYASYLWSNGSTLQNITVSTNGTFAVTVTDASGCSGTASETVTIPTPPQVQVLGASQLCEGDLTVLAAPGNFVQYLWSTGEVTPQITITQGGIYAVTVSDANGCTASDSWTVAQLLADFNLLQTTACSPLDTGTVTTLLTNQFGCDSVVVVMTILAQPIFNQIQLEVCEGENAIFNGMTIPVGSSQDFVFAGSNGCDSTVSVSVVAFPTVSFELEASAACQDLPNGNIAILMLGGEQPYQFSLNGGAYQTDTLFAGLPAGGYSVAVQDVNGCVYPKNVNIPSIPPMVAEAADETLVCGETVMLRPLVISGLPVTWQWSDSSGVVSAADRLLVSSAGTYTFTVTNACESFSGDIKVAVEPLKQAKLIYLPNSFSPNDDGINDCYQGFVDPKLELLSYELKIFDRWGDQIFETTNVEGCWDGWFRGKEMDPAVMVYWMRMLVRNCDGQVVEVFRKGDIHLVR